LDLQHNQLSPIAEKLALKSMHLNTPAILNHH